jgi:hypothetical protein
VLPSRSSNGGSRVREDLRSPDVLVSLELLLGQPPEFAVAVARAQQDKLTPQLQGPLGGLWWLTMGGGGGRAARVVGWRGCWVEELCGCADG